MSQGNVAVQGLLCLYFGHIADFFCGEEYCLHVLKGALLIWRDLL